MNARTGSLPYDLQPGKLKPATPTLEERIAALEHEVQMLLDERQRGLEGKTNAALKRAGLRP
jgi:hypothetical protein